MIKVPTKLNFGVPSLESVERIDDSDRIAKAQAEHYRLTCKMRELECQFEQRASELRTEFVTNMTGIFSGEA
jgi:hypothetical protein